MPAKPEVAALILRVSLGAMYLAHAIVLKLMTFSLDGTSGFFEAVGLPGWLAYATFVAEAVGGIMLVFGLWSRWVVVALAPALIGAIVWVHGANGWVFTAPNGGWEYPAFLLAASLVQFLLGDGAYSVSPAGNSHRRTAQP